MIFRVSQIAIQYSIIGAITITGCQDKQINLPLDNKALSSNNSLGQTNTGYSNYGHPNNRYPNKPGTFSFGVAIDQSGYCRSVIYTNETLEFSSQPSPETYRNFTPMKFETLESEVSIKTWTGEDR